MPKTNQQSNESEVYFMKSLRFVKKKSNKLSPRKQDRGQIYEKIMEKSLPTFEQMCDPAFIRSELVSEKMGAVWVAFNELDGIINKSQLAKQYFGRTHAWLSQKINGCEVCNQKRSFTEQEYSKLSEALRDIARRLNHYADEIDAAEMES